MSDYLPDIYRTFRERHGNVAAQLDALASSIDDAGPLDERSRRLVKLGIAIGTASEGGVRSSARKLAALGAEPEEIRHAALLAITSAGLPTAMVATQWIDDVVSGS